MRAGESSFVKCLHSPLFLAHRTGFKFSPIAGKASHGISVQAVLHDGCGGCVGAFLGLRRPVGEHAAAAGI